MQYVHIFSKFRSIEKKTDLHKSKEQQDKDEVKVITHKSETPLAQFKAAMLTAEHAASHEHCDVAKNAFEKVHSLLAGNSDLQFSLNQRRQSVLKAHYEALRQQFGFPDVIAAIQSSNGSAQSMVMK